MLPSRQGKEGVKLEEIQERQNNSTTQHYIMQLSRSCRCANAQCLPSAQLQGASFSPTSGLVRTLTGIKQSARVMPCFQPTPSTKDMQHLDKMCTTCPS